MSISSKLLQDKRVWAFASVTGMALWTHLPGLAVELPHAQFRGGGSSIQAEPGRLQVSAEQVKSIPSIGQAQTIQTQYQTPASQSASERARSLYGGQPQFTSQPFVPPPTTPAPTGTVPQQPRQAATPQTVQVPPSPPAQLQPQPTAQPLQATGSAQGSTAGVTPTAGQNTRRGLMDRLVGKFRGEGQIPNGPPQDPGMRYTTVTEAARQGQQVSQPRTGTAPFVPPSVPGARSTAPVAQAPNRAQVPSPGSPYGYPPAQAAPKPGLLPDSSVANPIDKQVAKAAEPVLAPPVTAPMEPIALPPAVSSTGSKGAFIPPDPDSSDAFAAGNSRELASSANVTDKGVQSFPELKKFLQSEADSESKAPIPPQTAKTQQAPQLQQVPAPQGPPAADPLTKPRQSLPVLDLDSPLPKLESIVKKNADGTGLPVVRPNATRNRTEGSESVVAAEPGNKFDIPAPEALDEFQAPRPAPETPAIGSDPLVGTFENDSPSDGESELGWDLTPTKPAGKPAAQAVTSEGTQQDAATVAEAAPEQTDGPYTGMSLEEDLFLAMPNPAPGEPTSDPASAKQAQTVTQTNPEGELDLPLLPLPGESEEGTPTEASLAAPKIPLPAPAEPQDSTSIARIDLPASSETEPAAKAEEEVPGDRLQPSRELPQLQAPQLQMRVAQRDAGTSTPSISPPPQSQNPQSKLELIASRQGMSGLKGFCPVKLRDSRDLVDVNTQFTATFNGKSYAFSSGEALDDFLKAPEKYAPAARGSDVIHLSLTGEELEGSLDHAVWYKGRLYLFTSAETMETFVAAPSSHTTNL